LLPGFIDPHSHISMVGPFSAMANLRNCESFNDVIDTLKTYIKENELEETDVVLGVGYAHNFLQEAAHPTKDVLNQVSTSHPIFISHASGHVGMCGAKNFGVAGFAGVWRENFCCGADLLKFGAKKFRVARIR